MTQVYISGPITGLPDLNRAAFDHEERLLREVGYETFNPHSNTQKDHGKENLWRHYMRICVGQIPLCDSMRMLPDWQNSKGAVWEHRIAMMLGLEVTYCPVVEVPKW